MFLSTWTIDDFAPLGPVETAKAAGRWVVSRLVRAAVAARPEAVRVMRRTQHFSAAAANALRQAHAHKVSKVSQLNAAQATRPEVAIAVSAGRESLAAAMAARMADSQWARCSDTITQAIARTDVVERHQSAALQKLDLAQYGLSSLKIELSAVMAVPGFEAKASLHRLPARQARTAAMSKPMRVSTGSAAAA